MNNDGTPATTGFAGRAANWIELHRGIIWKTVVIAAVAYAVVDCVRFPQAMEKRKPTLKRWLPFAAELGRDDRLYERHPDYLYPPFFLVLLRPLTRVSPATAAMMWQLAKYVAIVETFSAAWGVLRRAGPLPMWVELATVVVALRFVHSDLRHGNINLFIAALVTGAAWLFVSNRRFAAGAAVAVAACIKVTPALWIVYFAWKRQWRALLGAALGAAIALEFVPWLVIGPRLNHELLLRWNAHVIESFVAEGKIESIGMNQSLTAVTNRLLGGSDLGAEERRAVIVDLNDRTIHWIQRGLALGLIVLTGWACRGAVLTNPFPLAGNAALIAAIEWSILAPVTLALSGYTWTGHFCMLVLPIATMFAFLSRPRDITRRFGHLVACVGTLVASLIFVVATDILTPAVREWTVNHGLPLLGALSMLAALIAARECMRGQERADQPSRRVQT